MAKGSYLNRQNRTTRLLGLLREDRAWTMQLLSESLGVSIRTLMRDCDELRNQGYPIETERGRGGGVRLSSRWGLEKLMLNNEEIINLLVSLAISESLNSPILAHHVKSLRQKLANIFPEKQRKSINQLRKRILMGNVASTEVAETYTAPKPAITDVVTDCFADYSFAIWGWCR